MKKFETNEKIHLELVKHPIALPLGFDSYSFRVNGLVALKNRDKIMTFWNAIIDTGALMSLIPKKIWEDLIILEEYGRVNIAGLEERRFTKATMFLTSWPFFIPHLI